MRSNSKPGSSEPQEISSYVFRGCLALGNQPFRCWLHFVEEQFSGIFSKWQKDGVDISNLASRLNFQVSWRITNSGDFSKLKEGSEMPLFLGIDV